MKFELNMSYYISHISADHRSTRDKYQNFASKLKSTTALFSNAICTGAGSKDFIIAVVGAASTSLAATSSAAA